MPRTKQQVSSWSPEGPIAEFIEPFKRRSRVHYGFHGYFTAQPFNVVSTYISHFSKPDELVADPFVGSGVTAVEALRLKRRAFGLDLNPFAVLLTKAKCSYVDLEKYAALYSEVLSKVRKKCEEIEALSEDAAESIAIPYWYPKDVRLPRDSDVDYLHEIFTRKQLFQLALIKSRIDKVEDCPERDLLLIQFCGAIRRANIAYSLPDDGRSATAGDFTIFQTGRYRIPKRIVRLPVLPAFIDRFDAIVKAKSETNAQFKDFVTPDTLQIVRGSATNLKRYLKSRTVDYVYTDPPYGSHIRYLDLSTVYNAWLKFDLTESERQNEAIEGGEIGHTTEQYIGLMEQSFSEISRVLKPERWMSLVFHHKEPSLWISIVEMGKRVGLEYKNTVVQHTKLPSWHKVDQPQSVLAAQVIVNMVRKDDASFFFGTSIALDRLVFNVAEREIVKRGGANLEEICNALVPELYEHNFSDQAGQTSTDRIHAMLLREFDFDAVDGVYQIRHATHSKLGGYIPMRERIRHYLTSFLRREKKAPFDVIVTAILPQLINGDSPSGIEILEELKQIARFDGDCWVFQSFAPIQATLDFDGTQTIQSSLKIPEELSAHDAVIYKLAMLANRYELLSKVGDQEQRSPYLKAVNQHRGVQASELSPKDTVNVNNIDCLWFATERAKPLFAFEVEHSTSVVSAFERFISLLKAAPDVGNDRRLVLVVSRQNKGKFNTAIRQSSYIGAPYFLNNKVRYMFEEDLEKQFPSLLLERRFAKFEGLLRSPELG